MQSEFGPSKTKDFKVSDDLRRFKQRSTVYFSKLTAFEKYCVFRYTIGSGSINLKLITGDISSNAKYWVYLFFLYLHNTVESLAVKNYDLPKEFSKYLQFFKDPKKFNDLDINSQKVIVKEIIDRYTIFFQKIILKAPAVGGKGIDVYKVATKYPGLPSTEPGQFKPTSVLQLPFNSTTVSSDFNFAPFITGDSSVLFTIHISRGSRVLYVPKLFHAYPFEDEVILPHSCIFNIYKYTESVLNYVDPADVNLIELQNKDNIKMGSVYEINEYVPCKGSTCFIRSRPFTIFTTNYVDP